MTMRFIPTPTTRLLAAVTFWAAVAPASACRGRSHQLPPTATSMPAPAPVLAPPGAGAPRTVAVEAGGKRVLEIGQQGETLTIVADDGTGKLIGERRDGGAGAGKRKYRIDGGAVVAEVKMREEPPGQDGGGGFKLRTPDGKLLWKVKLGANKIKISDDDEQARPFVLSLKHANKVKVQDRDERPLGEVVYQAADGRVSVRDANDREIASSGAGVRSALFGLLLIEAIPARDRQILMAEILAQGY
jgi:hypothetical protein